MRASSRILLLVIATFTAVVAWSPGAASATVLCKAATDPCPTGSAYPNRTVIEASTAAGAHSKLVGPLNINIQCAAAIKGEVTNAGGEATNVSGTVTSMSFTGCTNGYSATVLKKGTFSVKAGSSATAR